MQAITTDHAMVRVVSVDSSGGQDEIYGFEFNPRTGVVTLANPPLGCRSIIITARFTQAFTEPTIARTHPRAPEGPPALARPRREWWNRRP